VAMSGRTKGRLCVVDLFCGMGGFSCGAQAAGAQVVLAIDTSVAALRTHALNHPECRHVRMELGKKNTQNVAKLIEETVRGRRWHLHGSPPCQLLSVANWQSRDPKRGMVLVRWYLALVRRLRPDSWSMEQVPAVARFLSTNSKFENARLVNAADYGVSQTRRRFFVGDGWTLPPPRPEKHVPLQSLLPSLRREGGTHMRGYYRHHPGMTDFRSIDNPSYTLCAQSKTIQLFRKTERERKPHFIRNLTVAEHLRIQSFPPSWKFPDDVPVGTRFKMIGNSVCPLIAFLLIRSASSTRRTSISSSTRRKSISSAAHGKSSEKNAVASQNPP